MRERRYLFLFFFLLYALTSAGDIQGDSKVRWVTAGQIAETGWFDLPPGTTQLYVEGPDGRQYSFFGLGQSVCLIPSYVAGELIVLLPGVPATISGDQVGQFVASLVFFPLCGALAVLLLYLIATDIGAEPRTARWVAVLYGVATMHWHSSVNTYEATQIAVCLLTCLWAAQRAWRSDTLRYPILAMLAGGVAMMFRPPSVVLTAPVLLVAIFGDLPGRTGPVGRGRRFGHWFLAGCVGVLPLLGLHLLINQLRYGHPLLTGYAEAVGIWVATETGERTERIEVHSLWITPLWTGIAGQLLSPGKSLFLYNPILLIAVPALIGLWRRHRRLTLAIALSSLAALLLHSKYLYWSGDQAWGPRYLAETMGPLMLGLVVVVPWRRARWLLVTVAAASIVIQAASNVYSFGAEFRQQPAHEVIPDDYVWRWSESHFRWRFRNIYLQVTGQDVPPQIASDGDESRFRGAEPADARAPVVNIFPFKARAFTSSGLVHTVLLGMWLLGIALLGTVAWRWWASARAASRGASAAPASMRAAGS